MRQLLTIPARRAWLMLFGLMLCLGCGGGEQKAADELKAKGFTILSDNGHPATLILQGDADTLAATTDLLPALSHLKAINAVNSGADDNVLAAIGKIRTLSSLNLSGTAITDLGVSHLTGLKNISDLNLSATQISSTSLPHLAKLTSVEILNLSQTNIDSGLEQLKTCAGLTWLVVGGLSISDEEAAALGEMENLSRISMADTQISDAAVKLLEKKGLQLDIGGDTQGTPEVE